MEDQIWEDEDFVRRELGELPEEAYEQPYFWASPALISPVEEEGLLCPITPSTLGSKSESDSTHPSLESVTTMNPENTVTIPVVRRSLHPYCHHLPYGSPPALHK